MRIKDEDTGKFMVPCQSCEGGTLMTECCNGSSGCSCMGQPVNLGACHVCNGTGLCYEDADTSKNISYIKSIISHDGYLGSGRRY